MKDGTGSKARVLLLVLLSVAAARLLLLFSSFKGMAQYGGKRIWLRHFIWVA